MNIFIFFLFKAHERDQSIDFLLILVRMLWLRNSQNVKIILMSATIEIDKLTNYFRQVINGRIVPAEVMTNLKLLPVFTKYLITDI
ncbi:unnamed protein product [Rotaria magnacalcarata]|uniref:Uncharacterized protein n=2 Tax=Rotaria magnacalcarata TaxID=392030 RepID=A0A816C6F8_9BILA|nr:unnamed protein product [Rotaria magnacalcarata]